MKSLYETILKSTGSGKDHIFTADYLLKHGFKEYKEHEWFGDNTYIHEESGLVISYLEDPINVGWCVDIADEEMRKKNIPLVQLIKNIPTLELAIKWKQAEKDGKTREAKKLNDKLKKEVTNVLLG